jgi:hypothetical protein
MTKQLEFNTAISQNNFSKIKLLLKDPTLNISAHNNSPIQLAAQRGYFEIFEMLLNDSRVNPADDDNFAIKIADVNGNDNIVFLLLKNDRVKKLLQKNEITLYEAKLKKHTKLKLESF